MSNEILLKTGIIAFRAEYKKQLIKEFENPFIEALPNIISKEEIVKELAYKPNMSRNEMLLPKELRLVILQRVYKLFQPLPIHLEIWDMINNLIRQGYISRNPFNPDYKKYINMMGNEIINKTYNLDCDDNFRTTAQCGLLVGVSGMGKTTTVQRVLSKIPQVIVHNEYNNFNFNQIQVVWLKLEAPANGSIKALTLQFFSKVDELIGTNNMERYVSKHLSVDAMIPLLGQVANNIGLGLLIIDELQHLDKGARQIMNYFVALMNSFGVPLLLIGTPACYSMLQQELRIARRVTGSGAVIFNPLKNDKEFEILMKGIWKYQWNNKIVKLNKDIIDWFYEKTQGICDLVVKLFIKVQEQIIKKSLNQIDKGLIDRIWNKEFKLIEPMLSAIKSNNVAKKIKYEDIQELEEVKINSSNISKNTTNKKVMKDKKCLDINKSKKIKVEELSDKDIRKIVLEGKKKDKSSYSSLKENKIISSIENMLGVEL